MAIFPKLCLWRRSLCSNLGGIDPEKLYRATLKMPRNMPRNWVWNFNPNPIAKTDEVNGALIGRCAKEKLKKKGMEEVKSENWQRNC